METGTLKFSNGKKTHRRQLVFLLAAIIAGLYLAGCESSVGQDTPPPPQSVPEAKPLHLAVTEWDEYTGRFKAMERV